jgi:hypothetical protein
MNQIKYLLLNGLLLLSLGLHGAEVLIAPIVYTPIQLSRVAIDEHKKNIVEDIAFKRKLKPAIVIALASTGFITACVGYYQWGALIQSGLEWSKNQLVSLFWTIPSKEVVVSEALMNELRSDISKLKAAQYATLYALIHVAGQIGILALFADKFKSLVDAVLNYDSYKRFFTHSSLVREIDFMRHSAHIIEMPNQAAINKEYHTKELVRLSEELILQAEEAIAFLEYKAENSSIELVAQYALDSKVAYLFAITNELTTELMTVLSGSSNKKLVSLIDAYRTEIKLIIDTCCAIQ